MFIFPSFTPRALYLDYLLGDGGRWALAHDVRNSSCLLLPAHSVRSYLLRQG
jgi:hypothetical protein